MADSKSVRSASFMAPLVDTEAQGPRMSRHARAAWLALGAGSFVGMLSSDVGAQASESQDPTAQPVARPTPPQQAPAGAAAAPGPASANYPAPTGQATVSYPAVSGQGNASAPSYKSGPVFLSVGYIASWVDGPHPASGSGVEASLLFYPDDDSFIGAGPLVQYQAYGEPDHTRSAVGIELALPFVGVDAFYAYRSSAGGIAGTHGFTLGPYLSFFGVLHVAGRFNIALAPNDGWGNESGVTVGLKLPIPLSGDFWQFGHGRPFAIDGQKLTAALDYRGNSLLSECSSGGTRPTPPARPSPQNAELQQLLGEYWLQVAQDEHASVAAFNRLSLSLLGLGAPLALLTRCQKAALDELRHARAAADIAEGWLGRPLAFAPLAGVERTEVDVDCATVAVDSLLHGCFAEGAAARVLTRAAREALDPVLSQTLKATARDEQRHAELSWAIVEYCLELAPARVRARLLEWFDRNMPRTEAHAEDGLPSGYGALSHAQCQDEQASAWAETSMRLHQLLELNLLAA